MTTTASLSLTESLATPSSNTILTVTITRDDAATSITPTVSSESALITDTRNTVSSDLTLVYVFTKSATEGSSSSGSSSGSKPSGLSSGAIAGIVIGSVILLIFLVLVVFCTSRRFARKRRREVASLHPSDHHRMSRAAPSSTSHHKARSQRSTIYSSPASPPQELATHFNRLEVDGRGKPIEVLGSYKHPVELHGGSTTDLVAHVWKGARSPAVPRKDEGGVIYIVPARRGDDVISDTGSMVCLSPPGTWETVSWGASVSVGSEILLVVSLDACPYRGRYLPLTPPSPFSPDPGTMPVTLPACKYRPSAPISQLPPQVPQLRVRIDAQRVSQVNVDALSLQPLGKLQDAVPVPMGKKDAG